MFITFLQIIFKTYFGSTSYRVKLIIYSDFKIIKIKLESMVRCMDRENVFKYHENNVSKPGEKILMVLNWLNFLYPNYDYQFSLMDCLIACCFLLISALM